MRIREALAEIFGARDPAATQQFIVLPGGCESLSVLQREVRWHCNLPGFRCAK